MTRWFCVQTTEARYVSMTDWYGPEGQCYFRGKGHPHLTGCGWYTIEPTDKQEQP